MAIKHEEIKHEENGHKGRYYVTIDGKEAEMTYVQSGANRIIVDHTFVPPELRGRNIAKKLVIRGVEDARSKGLKIVPLCPYVAKQFKRHPDWDDILDK